MSLIELSIFTNSTRSAPSTEIIKRTYDSFTDVFGKIPVRVYMDINPNVSRAERYSDALQKLFKDVIITRSLSQGYLSAIRDSKADYLFNLEHDWIFNKSLIKHSLVDICQIMNICGLYHFRFNKRSNISAGWEKDIELKEITLSDFKDFKFCLTSVLSNNPHVINRCYYLDHFMERIKIMPGSKGIEAELSTGDLTGGIYGPRGYQATVHHLDGRRTYKVVE